MLVYFLWTLLESVPHPHTVCKAHILFRWVRCWRPARRHWELWLSLWTWLVAASQHGTGERLCACAQALNPGAVLRKSSLWVSRERSTCRVRGGVWGHTDSNTNTDSDINTDSDTNTDFNTDTDSDINNYSDTDTDCDTDSYTGIDSYCNTDSDINTD